MRFELIRQYAHTFSIQKMAKIMKVSRSGYYAYLKRSISKTEQENVKLEEFILSIYEQNKGLYGSPRIHAVLRKMGHTYSRKRVAKLMRMLNLRARMNKKFKKRKKLKSQAAPNLLKQNFFSENPNQVWVGDISYIKTGEGWLYLAAILDLFSRKVVGFAIEDHMRTDLVESALAKAFFRRRPPKGLVHHSDRGAQYTSESFGKQCKNYSITLSMSSGSCYDNAAMESFFHTLKTELVYLHKFSSKREAKMAIFEYIEAFYNRKRLHSTLGYNSPEVFEENYREQKCLCL